MDWSYASGEVSAYAIHLVLLPEDGQPYHSRLLWWNGHRADGFAGREMGWLPGNDGCASFPDSSFKFIGAPGMPEHYLDIFCSGHSMLADGRLFTPGGTSEVTGSYGEKRTRIFTPGSGTSQGTWSNPGDMSEWRWYPSSTTLRDGRVLITSGDRHRHHRFIGGFRNGVAGGAVDTVFRFAPVAEGEWESPVRPAADAGNGRPAAREGHSAVEMYNAEGFDKAQVLFGGRGADSALIDDAWLLKRLPNTAAADYAYAWQKITATPPPRRSEHTAIALPRWTGFDGMMVVLGGLGVNNVALSDVRRLRYVNNALQWSVIHVTNPGSAPSARFGHGAVYDERTEGNETYRRMIVFGGTSAVGQAPSDANVYELRFNNQNPDTATWYTMTQSGSPLPPPTYRHTLTRAGGGAHYMYGGIKSNGDYGDALWKMTVQSASAVAWSVPSIPAEEPGVLPGKRARHSTAYDPAQERLYVFGGSTPTGQTDSSVYIASFGHNPQQEWERWASPGFSLAGHTVVLDEDITRARWPDIFDPAATGGPQFQEYPEIGLLQGTYPPIFVVPGGTNDSCRVVTITPWDYSTYQLNIPSTGAPGPWRKLPNGSLPYFANNGASFRPGRIMLTQDAGEGRTWTLGGSLDTAAWRASGNMLPRSKHNLVLLPTGQVLAVGGIVSPHDPVEAPADPVIRPQIWDPDDGTWTDTTSASCLAPLMVKRNYHSTAILLPDGRVLSGGGDGNYDFDGNSIPDLKTFNLFCPPYLYKADGTNATSSRREIEEAPAGLGWGKTFTICVDDTVGIRKVCLIRSPATTHTFDENQLYVPLDFTVATNPPRLLATSPESPDSAPPGYYMLFVVGSKAGSELLPELPSIAKWVRLGPAGRDTCDTVKPEMMSPVIVTVTTNTMTLAFTAPADDGLLAASGKAKLYDLRRKTTAINNETTWASATQLSNEPTPGLVSSEQQYLASGMANCTWYHFALRAKDDNDSLSVLHGTCAAKTLGTGCSGGGSLRSPGGQDLMRGGRVLPATASAGTPGATDVNASVGVTQAMSGQLVITTRAMGDRGRRVVVRLEEEVSGVDPADDGAIVIQDRKAGAWRTRARMTPTPEDELVGLCALRDGGRAVLPGGYTLRQVAELIHSGGSDWALVDAQHSASGRLLGEDLVTLETLPFARSD